MDRTEALIKVYQEAQKRLINLIATKEAKGSVTWYQETLLKQVKQILTQLNAYSTTWAQESINASYALGAHNADSGLVGLGVSVSGVEAFAKLHTASIEVLVMNTAGMLTDGVSFVGRQIQDAVRQAGLESVIQKQTTGLTVRETKRILIQKLVDQGLNGIMDKRGRMISLDAYAATVARSTTREATNTATVNQLDYEGYDLVKMSEHNSPCAVCSIYEGRVYSISGRSKDYPPLSLPFRNGFANIHPNCRHVVFPYIPSLADNADRDRTFSNRPFAIDDRSKSAIERYNNSQKEKRQLRADKDQWQRYRLALGDDAPKTLSGFRRMKAANSERYNNLKSDYREFVK
jgi:hypothetical protein